MFTARARFSRDEDEERPEIEVLEFEFLSLLRSPISIYLAPSAAKWGRTVCE